MSKTIYIGGRLESKEKGNVVTGANAILDDTKGKKQNVINKETDDELLRLEQSKQDNLNFDNAPTENSTNPVTSGGVYTAEKALSDAIEAILLLIPSAATALNKLVDTNTMNSSISTATATFRGTYNAVSDLGLTYQATHAQIEAALDALGLTADNNDFVFVQIPVSDESQDIAKTERFKFNGTNWLYEYDLNTSGYTAAQWAAINSGITVALVTKLTDLPTAAALQLALNAKQDTLTFDNEPTASSQNPVTSGGIYLAIQAVATALSNYSDTTDGRLNTLEGLIPTGASSSNKLTDKAYVDGLIQAITELIPAEATTLNKLTDKAYVDGLIQAITELIPSEATSANQLADKAYVLAQILAATPAFKGQFVTLAELQAVASPKAGDLGIVRTKDSDGMDVFTVYQYLSNAWNVFYSLSYHPQTKPATTGTTGDYPYNGMGRVELAKNMVNTGTELAPVMVNTLTQDMFYKGAVGSRVPNTNTIFVIRYDYVLGENVTVPDNCVLDFEGGSISGEHTITGANTGINAGLVKIFSTDITLAGSWNVAEAYPEWFGAKGDGVTDDTNAVQKVLGFPSVPKIVFTDYYFVTSLTLNRSNVCLYGANPYSYIKVQPIEGNYEVGLKIWDKSNVTLKNIKITSDNLYTDYGGFNPLATDLTSNIIAVSAHGVTNFNVIGCTFENMYYCLKIDSSDGTHLNTNVTIDGCHLIGGNMMPLLVTHTTNFLLENTEVHCASGNSSKHHHLYVNTNCYNHTIKDCIFSGGSSTCIHYYGDDGELNIDNLTISGCKFKDNTSTHILVANTPTAVNKAKVIITDCIFTNPGTGIYGNTNVELSVNNCIFNGGVYPLEISSNSCIATVTNCTFNNGTKIYYCHDGGKMRVANCYHDYTEADTTYLMYNNGTDWGNVVIESSSFKVLRFDQSRNIRFTGAVTNGYLIIKGCSFTSINRMGARTFVSCDVSGNNIYVTDCKGYNVDNIINPDNQANIAKYDNNQCYYEYPVI